MPKQVKIDTSDDMETEKINWNSEVEATYMSVVDFDSSEVDDLKESLDKFDFTLGLKYLYSYGLSVHNPALVSCMSKLLKQVFMESNKDDVEKSVLDFEQDELTEFNETLGDEKFERVMKYLYVRGEELHNPALRVGMRRALKQVFMEVTPKEQPIRQHNGGRRGVGKPSKYGKETPEQKQRRKLKYSKEGRAKLKTEKAYK